ncbi:hypothetical protein FRD01_14580 [Microvenator marinus]|uniref:Uncharacterized protein n=1 Tax=Microvenator marinus TaxID=2600177 RepID=A0A5B8XU51_9DELT|nr:hypothetical protein [Microvenator marinus]QED28438.1 hypothetical protein FRD01_14580 [Microvenator marinus]
MDELKGAIERLNERLFPLAADQISALQTPVAFAEAILQRREDFQAFLVVSLSPLPRSGTKSFEFALNALLLAVARCVDPEDLIMTIGEWVFVGLKKYSSSCLESIQSDLRMIGAFPHSLVFACGLCSALKEVKNPLAKLIEKALLEHCWKHRRAGFELFSYPRPQTAAASVVDLQMHCIVVALKYFCAILLGLIGKLDSNLRLGFLTSMGGTNFTIKSWCVLASELLEALRTIEPPHPILQTCDPEELRLITRETIVRYAHRVEYLPPRWLEETVSSQIPELWLELDEELAIGHRLNEVLSLLESTLDSFVGTWRVYGYTKGELFVCEEGESKPCLPTSSFGELSEGHLWIQAPDNSLLPLAPILHFRDKRVVIA